MFPFFGLESEENTREEILTYDIAVTFGLMPEHRLNILFEPFFNLMYYMGFTWDSFDMGPLTTEQRQWFMGRLIKEIEVAKNNHSEIPTKAGHMNTSDVRGMLGHTKPFSGPRTTRN